MKQHAGARPEVGRQRSQRKIGDAVPEKICQATLQKPISCLHVTVVTLAAGDCQIRMIFDCPRRAYLPASARNHQRREADRQGILDEGNDEVGKIESSYQALPGFITAESSAYRSDRAQDGSAT